MDVWKRKLLKAAGVLLSIGLFLEALGYFVGWRASRIHPIESAGRKQTSVSQIRSENASLKSRIQALSPGGLYIVVDTGDNTLFLKQGDRVILKTLISAGSGSVLSDPQGERKWVFETPRGECTVQSKFVKPTWVRPDWAFIEEGKPIPRNFSERAEDGMLGDYALGIGNGYFIHGTLYTRLLGKNITHGCIRVGDRDLRTLYEVAPMGTRVLIF
jgi:lipoprotein-anchoring transpeptidase ErfK/SrfK